MEGILVHQHYGIFFPEVVFPPTLSVGAPTPTGAGVE